MNSVFRDFTNHLYETFVIKSIKCWKYIDELNFEIICKDKHRIIKIIHIRLSRTDRDIDGYFGVSEYNKKTKITLITLLMNDKNKKEFGSCVLNLHNKHLKSQTLMDFIGKN